MTIRRRTPEGILADVIERQAKDAPTKKLRRMKEEFATKVRKRALDRQLELEGETVDKSSLPSGEMTKH
jgi:hypothetical protein